MEIKPMAMVHVLVRCTSSLFLGIFSFMINLLSCVSCRKVPWHWNIQMKQCAWPWKRTTCFLLLVLSHTFHFMTWGVGKLWGILAPVIVVQVSCFLLSQCENGYTSKGAFHWDYPDQDQWSEITQILAHQRNWQIHPGKVFTGSFEVQWTEWSWITDVDPNSPKGKHPKLACKQTFSFSFRCFQKHRWVHKRSERTPLPPFAGGQ